MNGQLLTLEYINITRLKRYIYLTFNEIPMDLKLKI